MRSLFQVLRFIVNHPLNRSHRLRAIARFVRWQIATRVFVGEVAVQFVDDARLLVSPGMTGATGNVYCGLHEFEDMAFVLHVLRPGDRFIDVGANVGSFTILAAHAGCTDCISIEPSPATFASLKRNIAINDFDSRIRAECVGAGAHFSKALFTTGLGTVNHIVGDRESLSGAVDVEVRSLDDIVGAIVSPTIVKIDVEGYETEVFAGASQVLASEWVWAVIIELNGSGSRYGYDESALHDRLLREGFAPMSYEAFGRTLTRFGAGRGQSDNLLYVRNVRSVEERVRSAKRYSLWNGSI